MKNYPIFWLSVFFVAALGATSACAAGSPSADPADTVAAYFQSIADKDLAGAINVACAEWEDRARLDYESFNNLEIQVSPLTCQELSREGDTVTLQCAGNIESSYGNEVRSLPLDDYEFVLRQEAGNWLLCSY